MHTFVNDENLGFLPPLEGWFAGLDAAHLPADIVLAWGDSTPRVECHALQILRIREALDGKRKRERTSDVRCSHSSTSGDGDHCLILGIFLSQSGDDGAQ